MCDISISHSYLLYSSASFLCVYVGSLLGNTLDPSSSYLQSEYDIPIANVISLRSVGAIAGHIPAIETARIKVTTEMETMVLTGLSTLVNIFYVYTISFFEVCDFYCDTLVSERFPQSSQDARSKELPVINSSFRSLT